MRGRLVLVLAAALAGCGDGGSADIARDAADSLDRIRAGELRVELEVTPRGEAAGDPFGFRLSGPFELPSERGLPTARLDYTQFANGQEYGVTVESEPGGASITTEDGEAVALTEEQSASLELVAGGEGLGELGLELEDWIDDAETGSGPEIGGDATERASGGLDVSAALEDLARAAGSAGDELDEDAREAIEDAAEGSSIEVLVGEEDRALRRVELTLEVGGAEDLEPLLGISGGELRFLLEVARPRLD